MPTGNVDLANFTIDVPFQSNSSCIKLVVKANQDMGVPTRWLWFRVSHEVRVEMSARGVVSEGPSTVRLSAIVILSYQGQLIRWLWAGDPSSSPLGTLH